MSFTSDFSFSWDSDYKTDIICFLFQERSVNLIELIRPLFQAFWSFVLLFLICEFGQMITNRFDQLNEAIDDCDWSSFPKEIQKILPIIIQNTQRPVVLRTFENASCSRETFRRVNFHFEVVIFCYTIHLFWFINLKFSMLFIRWATEDFRSSWCFEDFFKLPKTFAIGDVDSYWLR